ncbi:probable disease resistance protein At5g04720 [Zingiber officinale]|uniref:probable disease resistance protein At5g04720 n=1 Tax=Zingiber officinale TaxID=94328 RepID=UPI001C4CEB20|nr:probable disease resistance protein At5g04720 [Zingiber officinale]
MSTSFAGEIATELIKELLNVVRMTYLCRPTAEQLKRSVDSLLPIVQEISLSGVELPQHRQNQLSELADNLRLALELARKAAASPRWNVYRSMQLARKMERIDNWITRWIERQIPAHVLADVHHIRADYAARFDRIERTLDITAASVMARGPVALGTAPFSMFPEMMKGFVPLAAPAKAPIAMGSPPPSSGFPMPEMMEGLMPSEEAAKVPVAMEKSQSSGFPVSEMMEGLILAGEGMKPVGVGIRFGKEKVKEMLMDGFDRVAVVGISGIGGSGKTTLAREICKDPEIRSYFKDRIYFETLSQSQNLESLKLKLWEQISGNMVLGAYNQIPQWQVELGTRDKGPFLLVLDDVWSASELEELVFRVPGCKILVVSRFKFPSIVKNTYEIESLGEEDALSLFCHAAFEQKYIPSTFDKKLVKQVVDECKGLPLALKVIGASLRDQPPKLWLRAKNKLARGESICESHENKLLERMASSIEFLSGKVRECFLDLGSFPEDKRIPLDVLINMWMELHDLDEEDAFAILVELSNKNLLTLLKDAQNRAGDIYSSYTELSVTQHDLLRDLALHVNSQETLTSRRRLIMPRKENELPKEWDRVKDQQLEAQIVSINTGEMKESDWFQMHFPKAEVLILNFSADAYFLPPFLSIMPNLKTLILINYGASCTTLQNLSVFTSLSNLRSLWLEKIAVPPLPKTTVPLQNLRKVSLVLCELTNSLRGSKVDLSLTLPRLSHLTIDHCIDVTKLPSAICDINSLECLSISNCHDLSELPCEFGKLNSLKILRVYACPALKRLPHSICLLKGLKYLDISQSFNLRELPEELGYMTSLEKFDMRECSQLKTLPRSSSSLKSLGHVICDEDIALLWKEAERDIPDLHIQVAEESFNLDWLVE